MLELNVKVDTCLVHMRNDPICICNKTSLAMPHSILHVKVYHSWKHHTFEVRVWFSFVLGWEMGGWRHCGGGKNTFIKKRQRPIRIRLHVVEWWLIHANLPLRAPIRQVVFGNVSLVSDGQTWEACGKMTKIQTPRLVYVIYASK